MDPKELRGLVEAYNQVYVPKENIEEGLRSAVKRLLGGNKKEAEAPKPESRGDQLRARYNVGPEGSDTSAKRKILDRAKGNAERAQNQVDMGNASQSYADKAKGAHGKYLKAGYSKYGADAPYQGRGNKARKRAAALNAEDFEFIVNALIEEGYDLSSYTWDEMYDICLDENRAMARDPEGRNSGHSKQPDPSKTGFTGIGNMSIAQIKKMSARIEKEKKENNEEYVGEAVRGESSERRRDLAAQRKAGDKPLSPAKGRDNANKMQRDINYFDKLTKKNNNEEVEIFDTVLEFLYVEGYAETLEEAEWLMANVIDEEAIEIICELTGGKGHPGYKAGSKDQGPMQSGHPADSRKRQVKGGTMSQRHGYHLGDIDDDDDDEDEYESIVKQQSRDSRERVRKPLRNKVKAARKVLSKEDYVDEAQVANRDPDKYEAGQQKKSAPVRGEKTPMPPRGDKRREDFEKWYAANGPK
jgi:hypothetical protein